MKFNRKARLDRSQIDDRRGQRSSGGFPVPGGGGGGLPAGLPVGGGIGGVVLLIVLLVVASQCSGVGLPGVGGGSDTTTDSSSLDSCATQTVLSQDCKINYSVNSIQAFWATALPEQTGTDYTNAQTTLFSGSTSSGCGQASTAMGPFYCPSDKHVYLDLTFFDDMLEGQLDAQGGDFAEAYVVAHEYGHHVQDLLGTLAKAQSSQTGPTSPSVRVELQADCFAGVWAHYATTVKDAAGEAFITDLTEDDIKLAIDAASAVGDDRIQQQTQGQVNEEQWTHGSAEERVRWFLTGYDQGQVDSCDTFATNAL